MLSDEEKKVIEHLKIVAKERTIMPLDDEIRIVLNLIDKQSKEIEENKKYIVQLTDEQYRKLVSIIRDETSKEWEHKIKAKIEEINKEMLNEENSLELFYRKKYCKEALQSLLEKE